jgi:choline dehydrogenase-like flavoprotein
MAGPIGPGSVGIPDVVIVGSGASGSVAARRLAEAGFSVVCRNRVSASIRASTGAHVPNGSWSAGNSGATTPTSGSLPVTTRSTTAMRKSHL